MSKKKITTVEEEREISKKAVLIALKHPRFNTDIQKPTMRMKKHLMDLGGFSDDNITLMIEDEPSCTLQPTEDNIRTTLYKLVAYAKPGDILFIHLIAHGCCEGTITSSDKQSIEDYFFRALINIGVKNGCTMTFVSDCLIEPAVEPECCSLVMPDVMSFEQLGELDRYSANNPQDVKFVVAGIRSLLPTNLSPVDILKTTEDQTQHQGYATPVLKTLSKLSKFIFQPRKSFLPDSRVILLSAFERDEKTTATTEAHSIFPPPPELFYPPPEEDSSTTTLLYGGFSNTILDVIEETHGQVTNLELAQQAMAKLRMLGIHQKPGLCCTDSHHAYAPFFCSSGGRPRETGVLFN